MKTPFLFILLIAMPFVAIGGTQVRDVVTTSALWRTALTNEDAPSSLGSLGIGAEYLVSYPTNLPVSASTSPQYPTALSTKLPNGSFQLYGHF